VIEGVFKSKDRPKWTWIEEVNSYILILRGEKALCRAEWRKRIDVANPEFEIKIKALLLPFSQYLTRIQWALYP